MKAIVANERRKLSPQKKWLEDKQSHGLMAQTQEAKKESVFPTKRRSVSKIMIPIAKYNHIYNFDPSRDKANSR